VPQRYPQLNLPQRVSDWTDDHYLIWFTQHGDDSVGDLILGAAALDRFLTTPAPPPAIAPSSRASAYPRLAEQAMSGDGGGSSAHGEHPKFATRLRSADGDQAVLVKFSPPRESPVGGRWSDLLIAEHHAHELLDAAGIAACRSEILMLGSRTYLEVRRFDRQGLLGRRGVTSLYAIDLDRYGKLDNWISAGERLHADGCISAPDLLTLRRLAAFGAMIANTDRHFGNIAFFDRYVGTFELAPAYDMLPMLFAPEHDQLTERAFLTPRPDSRTLTVWPEMLDLAQRYWDRIAADARVSADFQKIARACRKAIAADRTP
jgi:hypothetical protein